VGLREVVDSRHHRARPRSDEKVVVVNTRPWEYDPNTDPKATLISEVLAALQARAAKDKTRAAEFADRFKKLAGRSARFRFRLSASPTPRRTSR
jgi:hypothetical protein